MRLPYLLLTSRGFPREYGYPPLRCTSRPLTARSLQRFIDRQPGLWLLSVYYHHILSAELLAIVGGRAVNLHPSYLPWNKGAHPAAWSLLEGTPAGVTLHVMTPTVDAGPILAQRRVEKRPGDTSRQLYDRLKAEGLALLTELWPGGLLRAWPGVPQRGVGTLHRMADLPKHFDHDAVLYREAA